jgi:hypothetical protein
MSDFVFLFRATAAEQREAMGTPEAARQGMQAWMAWIGELQAGGHLKDPGRPLDGGGKVVRRRRMVTDGPYTESKELVAGFIVVEARDLAQAVELAGGCPMLQGEGSVEVRPVADLAF